MREPKCCAEPMPLRPSGLNSVRATVESSSLVITFATAATTSLASAFRVLLSPRGGTAPEKRIPHPGYGERGQLVIPAPLTGSFERNRHTVVDDRRAMDVPHSRGQQRAPCLLAKAVISGTAYGKVPFLECARECEELAEFVTLHSTSVRVNTILPSRIPVRGIDATFRRRSPWA